MSEDRYDKAQVLVRRLRKAQDCNFYGDGAPACGECRMCLRAELAQVRARLEEVEKQRDDFRRFGQQFERDARAHFEQSCANLRRAESAESALKVAEGALDAAQEVLSANMFRREEFDAKCRRADELRLAALTAIRERSRA